jgi:membrane protease YdiL (CAAX protease family)
VNEKNQSLTVPTVEATAPTTPAKPSTLRWIFLGADGLRAGWGILIFVALMAGFLYSATAITHFIHHLLHTPPHNRSADTTQSLTSMYLGETVPFIGALLITWIMSKIERRPNSVYGFGGERKLPNFFAGLGWGVLCLSLLVFTLWKTGHLVIDSRLLFGGEAFRYGVLWLVGFLLVGFLEEYLTRGYLLYTLTRGLAAIYERVFKTRHGVALGFWTAAVIFSFLFGLVHGQNADESPIGLLTAGLAAMVFCLSIWRTGSLWWAIGFHASWDWAQSYLYGVADSGLMVEHHLLATHPVGKPLLSGGATGPEGSIFVLAVLTLITLIILFTLPRRGGYTTNLPAQPRFNPASDSSHQAIGIV